MNRLPLGVARLDSLIGGGAPAGSVVLLAGEPGSGAREFLYTSAVMNGLALSESELFDLHYGDVHPEATLPDEIHYVSFTSDAAGLVSEMRLVVSEDVVEDGTDPIAFTDLSRPYFRLSPVPREWYTERTRGIEALGDRDDRTGVFEALGTYLNEHAAGNLVCIDSVTDLLSSGDEGYTREDVATVLKGLRRASHRWGGLVLLLVNREAVSDVEFGRLVDATDGTLRFRWERGGSDLARTMMVTRFRGVLSQLEDDDIVQFETELNDAGFDISDVRKIR